MGEAAGLGSMEGQKGWPQLTHSAQALEGSGIDQVDGQGFSWIGAIESNRSVQWIVISALSHIQRVASSRLASKRPAASSQLSASPPGSKGSGSGSTRSGAIPWC